MRKSSSVNRRAYRRYPPAADTENGTYRYIYRCCRCRRAGQTCRCISNRSLRLSSKYDIVQFLTRDACTADAVLQHPLKLVIGKSIELFHILALHIPAPGIAEDIRRPALFTSTLTRLRAPHVAQQAAQFAGSMGKIPQLLDGELVEEQYACLMVLMLVRLRFKVWPSKANALKSKPPFAGNPRQICKNGIAYGRSLVKFFYAIVDGKTDFCPATFQGAIIPYRKLGNGSGTTWLVYGPFPVLQTRPSKGQRLSRLCRLFPGVRVTGVRAPAPFTTRSRRLGTPRQAHSFRTP